ncbi:type II toxin-antitoxin system RelE/ParE family toxin [Cytophagales bacterium LB-30]|uniref:Type II toxin-antitoxin system RelE/ParE family toxin n=1 Tax=Shiella aurantiaca TaxID=3058365 RepID=A0ABT8F536_9BACT|nr:type II toxin-antitoxin system RelE/ParE family toxin [Shiella aurantiaca]MDN4165369.1 type II toxin-antitoxin system RelE/ParE family toxin [Shiella aurantiaca]
MVEIRWLKEALDDMKDIHGYIARDSKSYARRQVVQLTDKVQILKTRILIGKIVEEVSREDIREIVHGHYRIIYRIVNDKRVDVLFVHHGARDIHRRLKDV